ncbi:MAG TPA: hypothetical protein VHK68_05680 [Gemmatimonadales bacterium]|jgi:hypothetical protein|nr:hypothetical protein [Gemmatimonadales bacterium]
MGFFGMLFWIAVLWFAIRALRRSDRCVAVGSRGYWPGWYRSHRAELRETSRIGRTDRDDYIDSLETRLSQLEERLDFTERLLEGR